MIRCIVTILMLALFSFGAYKNMLMSVPDLYSMDTELAQKATNTLLEIQKDILGLIGQLLISGMTIIIALLAIIVSLKHDGDRRKNRYKILELYITIASFLVGSIITVITYIFVRTGHPQTEAVAFVIFCYLIMLCFTARYLGGIALDFWGYIRGEDPNNIV